MFNLSTILLVLPDNLGRSAIFLFLLARSGGQSQERVSPGLRNALVADPRAVMSIRDSELGPKALCPGIDLVC
jgi:hypothetical protein